MTKCRFANEFKDEAVIQVLERGYAVGDVAQRLEMSVQNLYKWVRVYSGISLGRHSW
jgi:transposase